MRDHKSLHAWQEAKAVTKAVLALSMRSWKPWLGAVFSQLQRSSLSVQLNIAEGYGYGESATMRNHLRIAYASAIETDDLLELLSEAELCPAAEVAGAMKRCRASQKLLIGLMRRYGTLSSVEAAAKEKREQENNNVSSETKNVSSKTRA